jgi:hypothetical protein
VRRRALRRRDPPPARLARSVRLALAAVALLVAAACTGTFQPALPLALLVVDGAAGAPSRVLGYAVDPPGPATPRAVRPLGTQTLTPDVTGPVVGLDWLDRDESGGTVGGGRNRLVLLVSQQSPDQAGRSASIRGYDTSTFDVDAPGPLDAVPDLTLVGLVSGGVLQLPARPGVQAPLEGVCLDAVSVSRDGRFLALLDRRTACDAAADPTNNAVLLIDTVEQDLAWSTAADPGHAAPPIIDQGAGRLDFLRASAMESLSLADLTLVAPSESLPPIDDAFDTVRFARHGPDRLVTVGSALYRIDPTGAVTGPVSTQSDPAGIVETAPGLPVLIRTPARFVVHDGPADDDEEWVTRPYRSGTTDVADQLTYLVRPGAIDTFDLLLYDPSVTNPVQAVVTAYGAADLTDPRLVTWFRPRPTGP